MKLGRRNKRSKSSAVSESSILLTASSPFAIQEAYKTLRTNIIFSTPSTGCRTILVTSSLQGEAKSTTATNLGIAFGMNGDKTLLIDCDLRLPTISKKMNISDTPGLTDVLVGVADIGQAIKHISGTFDVLPAGTIPPNPTELLGSDEMSGLLVALQGIYEYIILDTPPVCTVADASILSKSSSGVILVVKQDVATRDGIEDALQNLELAGAKVLGFLMTGVGNDKNKAYKRGYYGYGGYSYSYSQANQRRNAAERAEGREQNDRVRQTEAGAE